MEEGRAMSGDIQTPATASRETSYRLSVKQCSACKVEKPRVLFPKLPNRKYADRCQACRDHGWRAKPRRKPARA